MKTKVLLLSMIMILCSASAAEASVNLTLKEARHAASSAAEDDSFSDGFVVERLSSSLVRLTATASTSREWDGPCPNGFGCSPNCHWRETDDMSLIVYVRELRHRRYRVRDNLGFSIVVR